MLLRKSITFFLEHCKFEKKLHEKTLKAYTNDLGQFERYLNDMGIKEISAIDKVSIKSYVQSLSKYAVRTVRRKIASAKVFLNFLVFEEYLNSHNKCNFTCK